MTQEKQKTKKQQNVVITDNVQKYIIIHDEKRYGFEFMPNITIEEIRASLVYLIEELDIAVENHNKKEAAKLAEEEAKEKEK